MEQASFICCQTKVLLGYLKRELPALRQAGVSRHLEQCPQCRAIVADLSEVFKKEIKAAEVAPLKNARRSGMSLTGEQPEQAESLGHIFLVRYAWLSLLLVLLLLAWLVKLAFDREYVKITKVPKPELLSAIPPTAKDSTELKKHFVIKKIYFVRTKYAGVPGINVSFSLPWKQLAQEAGKKYPGANFVLHVELLPRVLAVSDDGRQIHHIQLANSDASRQRLLNFFDDSTHAGTSCYFTFDLDKRIDFFRKDCDPQNQLHFFFPLRVSLVREQADHIVAQQALISNYWIKTMNCNREAVLVTAELVPRH